MEERTFVTRELEPGACIRVGNTLRANAQELARRLEESGEPLPSGVKLALERAAQQTDALDLFARGSTMPLVDRGADRSIAGLCRAIDGIAAALSASALLDLSAEAQARLDDAQRLLELAFPEGTGFLRLDYDAQWEALRELEKRLQRDEAKDLAEKLGLQLEVARALAWIDLYGKRSGITQHQNDPGRQLEALLSAWHEAYEEVADKAKGAFDRDDPRRQLLLSPYLEELEKLREESRERTKKYRDARKGKAPAD